MNALHPVSAVSDVSRSKLPENEKRETRNIKRVYHFRDPMEIVNPAREWLELAERYRRMSESELLDLAKEPSKLTDLAQQVLAHILYERRLESPAEQVRRRRKA